MKILSIPHVPARWLASFFLTFMSLLALPAHAAVNVLGCEPEWAALAAEIGGNKVRATSATTAMQDPHRIEARPSLIARTRNASLLVCTGLDLETGWLPVLLQQAGNPRIMPGQPGYLEAGTYVARLEVPTRLDRADGDVHAAGNPHIQQDPRNIARVAEVLTQRLAQIDPANAAYYRNRHRDFSHRWNAAMQRWNRQAAPLRGVAVVEHHKNMAYLLNWLGMRSVGTLEPKPGVEPSASHLARLAGQLRHDPAKMVLRAAYQDPRASKWLADRARVTPVVLPFTVGGSSRAKDLFGLFDDTIQKLLEGAR